MGERSRSTNAITVGVEEEFLIVDRQTRALASSANKLVNEAQPAMGESVSPELNLCQIETSSIICTTTDELRADLRSTRRALGEAAAIHDQAIIASGTHPFSSWEDQRVNLARERYAVMEDRYQAVARQQIICGCHVHVGIEDPDLAIEVMNRSRPWLPTLLALSANSPYWHGVDTGFASYRTQVWQRWPTSGMPPYVSSRDEYDALITELEEIGAIEDATHIYWYVRPSARYATVEYRPCDVCLDVEDTVAIAALVRALAWTCAREVEDGVPTMSRSCEAMNASIWRAARYGLEDDLVDARQRAATSAPAAVAALVDHVADGLTFHGDLDLVRRQVATILRRGNGAVRQRRAQVAADGDPRAVVDFLVERTNPDAG